ncbi:MAG: Zn-dependent hydrolase [Bacteroidales bacterium]|nr:Zn-dependent hydrolase [Bacteroidales bacterium]
MLYKFLSSILLAMVVVFTISCQQAAKTESQMENEYSGSVPGQQPLTPASPEHVAQRLGTFAPFTLTSDISHLSAKEKQILSILFDVADIMDGLFWQQAMGPKDAFLARIQDETARKFALVNYGPWDRLDGNKSFIVEIGPKPEGANFYPVDMTKEEFEAFNDPNKKSLYTIIRRNEDGTLRSIWYHQAFETQLKKAAVLIKQAASLAEDAGLKKYLELRADALLTSQYQASDFAWMEMRSSDIDFVVGPIENYEDALFGYKAAFESYILIKDPVWSARLVKYAAMLPNLQRGLPVKDEYKTEIPGADADLNAYDVVYYAGDCNAGSKTIAINLPNDEEVQLKKGSRKLQLKNAMQAKFDKIMIPIADLLIDPSQRNNVTFNAFFENTMFHEVAHAMGVKNTINGKGPARTALKEMYSSIEEGKADIMGLYLVTKLYEMGELTEGQVMDNYVTFFAGTFRSVRFGAASAHGKSNMMRFNFFREEGAFTRNTNGTFTVDFEKTKAAMEKLVQKIVYIQGDGDYAAAKQWVETEGVVKPDLQADLERINAANIPVDVVFEKGKKVLGL